MLTKSQALTELASIEGMDEMDLLEQGSFDGVAKGICLTCGYSCDVEPDSTSGWCETCETNSVQSCLVLAGII